MVSVILDGENAWEYYPYNGFYFLDDLYRALEEHPSMRTATFSEVLSDPARVRGTAQVVRALPPLVAGSWVYGNLATWIGSEPKNRAWDLLASAKQSYNLVMASGRLSEARLTHAEPRSWPSARAPTGSGGSATTTRPNRSCVFDRLFRAQSRQLVSAAAAAGARATCRNRSAAAAVIPISAAPCAGPHEAEATRSRARVVSRHRERLR